MRHPIIALCLVVLFMTGCASSSEVTYPAGYRLRSLRPDPLMGDSAAVSPSTAPVTSSSTAPMASSSNAEVAYGNPFDDERDCYRNMYRISELDSLGASMFLLADAKCQLDRIDTKFDANIVPEEWRFTLVEKLLRRAKGRLEEIDPNGEESILLPRFSDWFERLNNRFINRRQRLALERQNLPAPF